MSTARKDNATRQQYREEGYYVARGLFSAARVQGIVNHLKQLLFYQSTDYTFATRRVLADSLEWVLQGDPVAYVNTLRLFSRLVATQEFLLDPLIQQYVRMFTNQQLATTSPVLSVMSERLRLPGGYQETPAHQDWSSLQGSLDAVTVWVPLTRAERGNYPLAVIERSHRLGRREGVLAGSVLEVEVQLEENFTILDTYPGDVVFMSALMVHRTGLADNSESFRLALSTRYENALEPTFVARGYPSAQKRSTEYAPITPGFPTRKDVQKVFD